MSVNLRSHKDLRREKPAVIGVNQLIRLPKLSETLKGTIYWSLREWRVSVNNELYQYFSRNRDQIHQKWPC